jgi:hypothetical protein
LLDIEWTHIGQRWARNSAGEPFIDVHAEIVSACHRDGGDERLGFVGWRAVSSVCRVEGERTCGWWWWWYQSRSVEAGGSGYHAHCMAMLQAECLAECEVETIPSDLIRPTTILSICVAWSYPNRSKRTDFSLGLNIQLLCIATFCFVTCLMVGRC